MWLHTANPFLNEKDPPLIAPPERSGGFISGSTEIRYITARCRKSGFSDVRHSADALQSIHPNVLGRSADAVGDAAKSIRICLELLNPSTPC
jgi:hypothetical protein